MLAVMPIASDALLFSLAELAAEPRPRSLIGGKAASLAKLLAAGLPVPDGVVLTTRVTELPAHQQEAALDALTARARALGAPLAVRSSATIEDGVASAAPGIFVSRLQVDPGAPPHGRNDGQSEIRGNGQDNDQANDQANEQASALIDAVRAVWASAQTPLVRAYAEMRQLGQVRMAVIVQPQIPGLVAGVAYTRPPGHPDAPEMLIETHATATSPARALRVPRGPAVPPDPDPLPLDAPTLAELVRIAARAEDALGASAGADVEWVASPAGIWIVQARPIVHPTAAPAPAFPDALIQFSCARPDQTWRWDVSHNPDPLSPAQIGLVERMDRAGLGHYRMRVVGGYLYTAEAQEPAAGAPARDEQAPAAYELGGDMDAERLRHEFETAWLPALERALAAAETPPETRTQPGPDAGDEPGPKPGDEPGDEPGTRPGDQDARDPSGLIAALAAYERFYAVYAGALTTAVSRARRVLPAFLRAHACDSGGPGGPTRADAGPRDAEALAGDLLDDRSPARLETLVARVAQGHAPFDALLAAAGPMSPAWDVTVPTFAETPDVLHQAVALAAGREPRGEPRARATEDQVRARLAPGARDAFTRCLALARAARDIGELDDRLYARAQAAVRHALLRLARRWRLHDPEDIFFIPLDTVLARASDASPPDPTALRRMARAGRAARERQRAWVMPLAFAGGRPIEPAVPAFRTDTPERSTWQGRGTGGRARGTAVRIADLQDLTTELTADLTANLVADVPADVPADLVADRTALLSAARSDAILVVSTITPAMALVLPRAMAVVAQHGGLLGHGAAMARELDLPCVVDCPHVWQDLRTGDPLWVDGEAGLVVRTRSSAAGAEVNS